MGRPVVAGLYVVAMVAAIVGVDIVFFRDRVWERLTVNIGMVLVFVVRSFLFAIPQESMNNVRPGSCRKASVKPSHRRWSSAIHKDRLSPKSMACDLLRPFLTGQMRQVCAPRTLQKNE